MKPKAAKLKILDLDLNTTAGEILILWHKLLNSFTSVGAGDFHELCDLVHNFAGHFNSYIFITVSV